MPRARKNRQAGTPQIGSQRGKLALPGRSPSRFFTRSSEKLIIAKIAKVRIEVTLAGVGELALEELVDRSVAVTRAFDVGA